MKNLKNPYTTAQKDRFNSTFVQEIEFESGKKFTGYSALSGFSEKNDKQATLINFILRMYKIGYLDPDRTYKGTPDPIRYIEYFLNLQSGKRPILRLYYNFYEAFEGIQNYQIVIAFLDSFYKDIHLSKLKFETIFNKYYRTDRTRIIDPMDYSVKRFFTLKSLQNYLTISTNNKTLSYDQAMYFKKKYMEFHNLPN